MVSIWLAVSRFVSVSPVGTWSRLPVENGPRSVSSWFSGVFVSGVPETPLPTLKTGNGESRSWVQIPPHPFFWNGFFLAAEGLFLPWNDGSGGVGGGWLACRWRLRSSAPAHRNASARRTFPLSSSGAAGALTLEKPTRPRRQLQHLVRRLGVSRASHAAPAISATRTRLAYRTCRCRTQACPWTPGRTATQPPAGDAVLGAVRPPRHGGG